MPDTGTLEHNLISANPLRAGVEPLVFEQARWVQVTFEVPRGAAVEHMPSEVTRPIPCYGRFFAAEGLVGGASVSLGALTVGGRFMMMPRNVLVSGVTSNASVAEVLTNGLIPGTVAFERDGASLRASVSVEDVPVATANLPGIYAIEPSMLRWDPWLAVADHDGGNVLTEIVVTTAVESAFLSKGATVEPDPTLPRTHPLRQLRNLLTISACYAEGTLTFGPPRVLDECS